MQQNNRPFLDFDPAFDPETPIECLGEVTTPSGVVLVIDTGLLSLWSHDREPIVEEGSLSNQHIEETINSSIDLEIEGADAIAAGLSLNRQWHPRFLYDIPINGVSEMRRLLAESISNQRLEASLQAMAERIPHRRRVDLALEWGKGQGEVQYHGIPAVAVSGLPRDRTMKVYGVRMNTSEHWDRWRWVWLEALSGLPTSESKEVGHVGVDYARLMFADVNALGQWEHESSLDGKADFVFWGQAEAKIAEIVQAPQQVEGYGWIDLPIEEIVEHGLKVEELIKDQGLKMATDFRPHSHHYQAMKQVRATDTESGVVEVGGAKMCVFMTSWGDGMFPLISDKDKDGQLLRLRLDLGNQEMVQILGSLNIANPS